MDVEQRTNPNTTLGTAGEFAPPLWIPESFSTQARAGRVLGDLVQNVPLTTPFPSSVNVPNITTGADANIQAAQGNEGTSVDQVTANAKSPVVTITGNVALSTQLYDLTPTPPGYDLIAFTDLSRAYNANLEAQLLAGSGTNGQLRGVENLSGINAISYADASPTFAEMWPSLGQAQAAIGNTRLQPLEVWLFAPRRWGWFTGQLDDDHRPIVNPGASCDLDDELVLPGGATPVGPIGGRPVYESGAIPAGANPTSSSDCISGHRYCPVVTNASAAISRCTNRRPRFSSRPTRSQARCKCAPCSAATQRSSRHKHHRSRSSRERDSRNRPDTDLGDTTDAEIHESRHGNGNHQERGRCRASAR
jgi:hypothetical protein